MSEMNLDHASMEDFRNMAAALARAEALHKPLRLGPEFRFKPWCGECSTGQVSFSDDGPFMHKVDWPCPTAVVLGMADPLADDA